MVKGYYISEYTVFVDVLFLCFAVTVPCLSHIFFDVHVTVHRVKFLIIKPSRCTNFSNLYLEWKSTCFGQFLCPSSGVFHCTHSNGIYQQTCMKYTISVCTVKNSWWWTEELSETCRVFHWFFTGFSQVCWHIPFLCVQWKIPDDGQRNCPKHVEFFTGFSQVCWHIPFLCVQWKTPDDGQRNCPKHVEFQSKNKLEKLVHLVGFIIRKGPVCFKSLVSNISMSAISLYKRHFV